MIATTERSKNIDLAIDLLKTAAANDPEASAYIEQRFAAAGFALPADLDASARSLRVLAVGDLDPARGVYLGTVEAGPGHVVHAYAAEDFLRDAEGRQLILNFDEAVKELNQRNGRRYGGGTDRAVKQAITDGTYRNGDLVLPSKELLHGRGVRGTTTRPDRNIYALLEAGKLPKIAVALATGKGDQLWAVSGSERPGPDLSSIVYHVSLPDGDVVWGTKACGGSGVVPVRYYSSASQAPAPKLGG